MINARAVRGRTARRLLYGDKAPSGGGHESFFARSCSSSFALAVPIVPFLLASEQLEEQLEHWAGTRSRSNCCFLDRRRCIIDRRFVAHPEQRGEHVRRLAAWRAFGDYRLVALSAIGLTIGFVLASCQSAARWQHAWSSSAILIGWNV